jgi:hypothetical protein
VQKWIRQRHTDGSNRLEVGGQTLAEDKGSWLVLGRVGEGVGLASLDTVGVGVDGDGEDGGDEGSARNDNLEETHVDVCGVGVGGSGGGGSSIEVR